MTIPEFRYFSEV